MTVTSLINSVTTAGDGTQTLFAFTFKIFESGDLVVALIDVAGVETLQTISTHYTLSGVGADAGGVVTMLTAPGATDTLRMQRELPLTQLTALKTQGSYKAESHEDAHDRAAMIAQQLKSGRVTQYTVAGEPTADGSNVNTLIAIRDPGVPGKLKVNLEKGTNGTYSWITIGTGEA